VLVRERVGSAGVKMPETVARCKYSDREHMDIKKWSSIVSGVQALTEGYWLRSDTTTGGGGRQRKVISLQETVVPTGTMTSLEQETWWLCSYHQM
jgi:hypothetical protein